jgi:hypothetical protein
MSGASGCSTVLPRRLGKPPPNAVPGPRKQAPRFLSLLIRALGCVEALLSQASQAVSLAPLVPYHESSFDRCRRQREPEITAAPKGIQVPVLPNVSQHGVDSKLFLIECCIALQSIGTLTKRLASINCANLRRIGPTRLEGPNISHTCPTLHGRYVSARSHYR